MFSLHKMWGLNICSKTRDETMILSKSNQSSFRAIISSPLFKLAWKNQWRTLLLELLWHYDILDIIMGDMMDYIIDENLE